MEHFIKVNGCYLKTKKMVVVYKSGQTVLVMMVFGEMAWQMDMAVLFMQKVMFMKENGLKIKLMGMECTRILMEADMKDNGFKINSMDMESNNGQMALNMRDNMNRA